MAANRVFPLSFSVQNLMGNLHYYLYLGSCIFIKNLTYKPGYPLLQTQQFISVIPVKNMQVVILKAVEDDLANVESTLACKASAKHKSMHTSNSIVTSSGVR